MTSERIKTRGRIFVISGPSGSGKTTLRDKLLKDKALKAKLVKSVSLTTRPRRSGERTGRDYLFISEAEFRQKKRAGKIIEWTRYLGYYYATPKETVEKHLKRGRQVLLCLDLAGALQIKKFYPKQTITIFIIPPSLEVLRERIAGRCQKTKGEEIRQRLKLAQEELLASSKYDYQVVNRELTQAVGELKEIILKEAGNN